MHQRLATSAQKSAPLIALLAAAAFGVSTPLAKLLLQGLNPVLLASLLYLGSGLGLAILFAMRKARGRAEASPTHADWPWLLGTVALGGIVGPVLLMLGLARTDAASASLLLNLESVFTLILAWVAFREHVDKRLFAGAGAIVAGALLLSWQGGFGTGGTGIVAGTVNGVVAQKLGPSLPTSSAAASTMTLGFVSYGLGLVLFIMALRHLGTSRT